MKRLISLLMLVTLSACAGFHPQRPYLPSRNGIESGETITVKNDENIYTVAREHNVSMRELIVLNDLKPPFEIRSGQSLILPAGGSSFGGDMKPPEAAPLAPVEKNDLSPITPAGVSSQQLEPIAPMPSSMPPASTVRPLGASEGPQSLVAPGVPVAPQSTKTAEPIQMLNQPAPLQKQMATTATPKDGASLQTKTEAASPAAAVTAAGVPMVWPVQGPVLSGFGPKGAGLNNDGVNIGAPKGSPVVAAAPGTVVYAGNEMKGFGNLVLIRHQGDWVTAYAHLDRVLVKKDAIVDQGDEIGTVGKTGNVPTPQLHFETRQNGKPVDPAGVVKSSL